MARTTDTEMLDRMADAYLQKARDLILGYRPSCAVLISDIQNRLERPEAPLPAPLAPEIQFDVHQWITEFQAALSDFQERLEVAYRLSESAPATDAERQ